MFRILWESILELLYPGEVNCLYCGAEKSPVDYELCAECVNAIEFVKQPCCMKCGKPVRSDAIYCRDCTEQNFCFTMAVPVAIYRGWLKDAIFAYKFRRQWDLAKPFARMMAGRIAATGQTFDIIVPVPMHPERLHQRGANHAALLAEYLGEFLGLPVGTQILSRTVDTLPQRTLKRSEREENLANAFFIKQEALLKHKRVLLVDDIYTTGFTAHTCSTALLHGGAAAVVVGILAIGVEKSRNLAELTEYIPQKGCI